MTLSLPGQLCPSVHFSPFSIPDGGDRPSRGRPQAAAGWSRAPLWSTSPKKGKARLWEGLAGPAGRSWPTLPWSRMGRTRGPKASPIVQEVNKIPQYFFLHCLKWKFPRWNGNSSLFFIFSIKIKLEQKESFTNLITPLFYELRAYLAQEFGSH